MIVPAPGEKEFDIFIEEICLATFKSVALTFLNPEPTAIFASDE